MCIWEIDKYNIRAADENDFRCINALCNQGGYDVTLEDVKYRCSAINNNDDSLLLVAESSGRILGWVQAHIEVKIKKYKFGVIYGLIVEKSARKQGIGSALMGAVELWCREKGCVSIRLCSGRERIEARRLFKQLGYVSNEKYYCFHKEISEGKNKLYKNAK